MKKKKNHHTDFGITISHLVVREKKRRRRRRYLIGNRTSCNVVILGEPICELLKVTRRRSLLKLTQFLAII